MVRLAVTSLVVGLLLTACGKNERSTRDVPTPTVSTPPAPTPTPPTAASSPPSVAVVVDASPPDSSPRRKRRCPPGECVLHGKGRCQRPTGQLGNGCCRCGDDGRCASYCRCNGPDVPIATPDGTRRIADLRAGDRVYSIADNSLVIVPLTAVRARQAPPSGYVRVELRDGSSFVTSAVHPLADGRTVAELEQQGQVRSLSSAPRPSDLTYDILPASTSGVYFVEGIVFASTLSESEAICD